MKLLYISKAFEGNIGATMHYNALKELYGVENVYTIDLRPLKAYRRDKYIAYGKYATVFERIIRWTQGNMMFISNKIIDEIVSYIQQEKFDVVFIEDSVFGNLVKAIKNKDMTVRVVTFYHDIGKGVVVGTGSLITNDLEDNAIYFGRPARLYKKL